MKRYFLLILCLFCLINLEARRDPGWVYQSALNSYFDTYQEAYPEIGKYKINYIRTNQQTKEFRVTLSSYFGYFSFTPEWVDTLKEDVYKIIAPKFPNYSVTIQVEVKRHLIYSIDELIANTHLKKEDKIKSKLAPTNSKAKPFVNFDDRPYTITQGLENRNLAIWQSHGWVYRQDLDTWTWQRPRLFTTCEDKYTQAYVLDLLVPMLENAGAYCLLPRERDTQIEEVIIDNDGLQGKGEYVEMGNKALFANGGHAGFKVMKRIIDKVNPFAQGTFRQCKSSKQASNEWRWIPEFTKTDRFAVYVSYAKTQKPVAKVHYSVHHLGGISHFTVNQKMGAGTWVYLGTFKFPKKGNANNCSVRLTNESSHSGIISADAVRFGGGIGNVARRPAKQEDLDYAIANEYEKATLISRFENNKYQTSGLPRYLEGARYWMQYAGTPEKFWSWTYGLNDGIDDFAKRGDWVNWLNYGSAHAPQKQGLGIPIDACLAFHSDAGIKKDSIIGTLGLFSSKHDSDPDILTFPNNQSRLAARDLADMVTQQIIQDIRRLYFKDWQGRGIRDMGYAETRVAEVPTMILELLSHQNFEDMSFGLDPRFQFTAARSVYKGLLKFICESYQLDYTVQPLPVKNIHAQLLNDSICIQWQWTQDPLEDTAIPSGYVVYTRRENEDFDAGQYTSDPFIQLPLAKDAIYSYKICAVNAGGQSMSSEIISAYNGMKNQDTVLIVNGFTRLDGPQGVNEPSISGFPDFVDHGVPNKRNITYCGAQYDLMNQSPFVSNSQPGHGASYSNYEHSIIAGNTFDFAYNHGISIKNNGYNFVSTSVASIENQDSMLLKYKVVDLILGEQKTSILGLDSTHYDFVCFPKYLQKALTLYAENGGHLIVSGAHIGQDLWHSPLSTSQDRDFAQQILHIDYKGSQGSKNGQVKAVYSPIWKNFKGHYVFNQKLNDQLYEVESPDILNPYGEAFTFLRYSENNNSAAICYQQKDYKVLSFGFPLESLCIVQQRDYLFFQIFKFLKK